MSGRGSPEAIRRASAAYYRRNREALLIKQREKNRIAPKRDRTAPKERARSKLRYAVWSGKITKPQFCEDCGGKAKLHGHHDDYTKPLEVRWLCTWCHAAVHAPDKRKSA